MFVKLIAIVSRMDGDTNFNFTVIHHNACSIKPVKYQNDAPIGLRDLAVHIHHTHTHTHIHTSTHTSTQSRLSFSIGLLPLVGTMGK